MGLSETCDYARRAAAWRLRSTRQFSELCVFSVGILTSVPLSDKDRTNPISGLRGRLAQNSLPLSENAISS